MILKTEEFLLQKILNIFSKEDYMIQKETRNEHESSFSYEDCSTYHS